MSVNYTRINWEDSPSTQTPLNAENLNAMDSAIDELAGAVNEMDGVPGDVEDLQTEIGALKNDLTQGTFPVGNAENAEQLTATVGIEDTAPYLFRTSGGSNDIGDREDMKKIVGGTVAWNQLARNGNFSEKKNWQVFNSDYSVQSNEAIITNTSSNGSIFQNIACVASHKYLCTANVKNGTADGVRLSFSGISTVAISDTTYTNVSKIYLVSDTANKQLELSVRGNADTVGYAKDVFCTDLTQDFGTAIADYVYSLEQATAGSGVAWLKKHFPKQFDAGYQAYDAGSLQSVSGLMEHKMVGFNQWNEEWESGSYNSSTGEKTTNANCIRSKNFIPCIGNTAYYFRAVLPAAVFYVVYYDADKNFIEANLNGQYNAVKTTPANARYMNFWVGNLTYPTTTYNHDICINFHWDGEKDGTYEPYKTWSYALDDSITLRGIPKVDASGNLYYDGDEYLPDGTVNRRYGVVDLGTLNWEAISGYAGYFKAETTEIINTPNGIIANALCPKYVTVKGNELSTKDKAISVGMNNAYQIQISDSAHSASSASDFKTAMSGVMLLYEKRLPTTETALPYQETQIVDDFGTEEFVLADGAFPVPVGHDAMYQNNLRAKLEMSPDSPDGDGLYVVQQESGENTYVPLASTATIQDILTRLTALENA